MGFVLSLGLLDIVKETDVALTTLNDGPASPRAYFIENRGCSCNIRGHFHFLSNLLPTPNKKESLLSLEVVTSFPRAQV